MKYLFLFFTLLSTAFAATPGVVWMRNGVSIISGNTVNGVAAQAINGQSVIDQETKTWRAGILAANVNATIDTGAIAIANELIVQIKAASFGSKIVYLIPLIGSNAGNTNGLTGAFMPLRDTLAVGIATNTGFTGGDYTQATGLQGATSGKYLDTKIKPSQLGTTNNGGVGYWETNIAFDGESTGIGAGCFSTAVTEFYGPASAATNSSGGYWGIFANGAVTGSGTATNGFFYIERSSATAREGFKNNASTATNTTSDAAIGAADRTMALVGYNSLAGFKSFHGRMGCAVFTNGTLGATAEAALYQLLIDYLFTPTGRPSS